MTLHVVLGVAVLFIGTSQDLDCFGDICAAGQYCLVEITQNTGLCYTHHGNGQHEAHQQCIGGHHPESYCFCMDQACVNTMSHCSTTGAPTTVTHPTTQAPMTKETTTTSIVDTTVTTMSTGTSQGFDCFGDICAAGQFCLVEIPQNTGVCYTLHGNVQHEVHQQCIGGHHPESYCFCMDQACVNAMSHSTTTAAPTSIAHSTTETPMTQETTPSSVMDSTVRTISTGTSQGFDCFGDICAAGQFCLVEIPQNTGVCYTLHGNMQHEVHQQCIGGHHPESYCFCMDQACVNAMSHSTTTAAPTSIAHSTTETPMTQETTPTYVMDSTVRTISTGTSQGLDCFGDICAAGQYCLVEITQNTGVCYTHHGNGQHEAHQQCIAGQHPGSYCFCMDRTCINIMSDGITTAAPPSTQQAPETQDHTTTSSTPFKNELI